jgi:hypothetical protein
MRHPVGPAVEEVAGEVGDLHDFGVVAPLAAVSGDRWLPGSFRDVDQDLGDLDVELMADHEPHMAVTAVLDEPM